MLGKERSVPLVGKQREFVHRSSGRVRNERSRFGCAGPSSLRDVLHKIARESVFHIADLRPAQYMAPLDVPGNSSRNRGPVSERVDDIVVVLYIKVAHLERCLAGREIHGDCALWNCNRPEQSAFGYPRVEIMDLQVLSGTCEDVESYKREGAVVVLAVRTDEFAEHEANVRFEREVLRSLSGGRMRAHAADRGPSNEAVEVRDR